MTASVLDHPTVLPTEPQTDTGALRVAMVSSQLRTTGVNDPRVIAAMAAVPRELYLPGVPPELAYRDQLIPIGGGRHANLSMATGKLLTEVYLRSTDRVLLIGAAGGYTAAVLARIVAQVTAVESDTALAAHARAALAGVANITLVEAPLPGGCADGAPYDLLFIDGAVENLPETLWSQVAIGGRVATGLFAHGATRLAAGARTSGGLGLNDFADVACAMLPGFAKPVRFTF